MLESVFLIYEMKKPYNKEYLPSVAQLAGDRAGSLCRISHIGRWVVHGNKYTTPLQVSEPCTKQQPLIFLDKSYTGLSKMLRFSFFHLFVSFLKKKISQSVVQGK